MRVTPPSSCNVLSSRTVINQAIGMGSFWQTADAAFDQLKQISQTENPKLYEVAPGMGE